MAGALKQLTLDFARLVAEKHDGVLIDDDLPDYPNDWNATIRAIEAKGWMWSMSHGHTNRLAMVGIVKDGHIFRDEMPLSKKEPPCVALMRAAVEAAKSIDKQTMDDNL